MARTTGGPGSGPSSTEWGAAWADAVEGWTRALQLGVDLQRRVTRSTWSGLDVGSGSLRDVQEEWRRYATQVTGLTVDYYRAVAEVARDYGAGLASSDRVPPEDHDHATSGSHDGRRRTSQAVGEEPDGPGIELRGPTGSVLATNLVIENRDADPAVVTVRADLARGPDGERFVAPLSVDPAALTIPAGGTAEVGLRVPLLAEVFETDVRYRIPLRVDGPRPTTIEVTVVAEAAARPPRTGRDAAVTGAADPDDGQIAARGSRLDGEGSPGEGTADATTTYRVRCPACERTFVRRTADLRLRPHKAPNGEPCPHREGNRVHR